MIASFVTKTKNDGSKVIDRDRSFSAFLEALEPSYEQMREEGLLDGAKDITVKEATDLIENDHSAVDKYILCGAIFNIVDSEDRDLDKAISFLELGDKTRESGFAGFCYYSLGFIYYCAPSGVPQNKSLALSYLRKAVSDDLEWNGQEDVRSALEAIIDAEKNNGALVLSESGMKKAPANLAISHDLSVTSVSQNKTDGLWGTVLNVAVSALSKISADKLNDPVFMRKVLGKAYELLPFWVRAVVSEELFFNFCFDRRSLIVQRMSSGNSNIAANEIEYVLPGDDEQPVISKDTILVNIVDGHSGNLFSEEKFYFFPTQGAEKFNNAYEAYIKEALEKYGIAQKRDGLLSRAIKTLGGSGNDLPEDLGVPLFMYDSTAFGSCKTGFLITSKMFIAKEVMTKPILIKLGQISSFEMKKSFLSAGKVYINDQMVIDCNQGKKESFQKFSTMFNEIIESA